MAVQNVYSIKELEVLSGIKAHTIRIWEKRYQLFEPERTETNIRYYTCQELKKLLNISMLIEKGHKISKLSALSPDVLHQTVSKTFIESSSESDFYKSQINQFVISMLELDEALFDKTFSGCVLRYGLENTMIHVVYPFLNKVGMMWCVNNVSPSQEHFVSNLIRQKIHTAIDSLVLPTVSDPDKTYLLYLPENEDHEIGLLMSHYMLKKEGYKVIYLGAKVPFYDLAEIIKISNPANIMTFFITPRSLADAQDYLYQLEQNFSGSKFIISGNHQLLNHLKTSSAVTKLYEITDLIPFLRKNSIEQSA